MDRIIKQEKKTKEIKKEKRLDVLLRFFSFANGN